MTSPTGHHYGERFTSREPSKSKKTGRQCAEPDCETILSIYNDLKLCSIHGAGTYRVRTRGTTIY